MLTDDERCVHVVQEAVSQEEVELLLVEEEHTKARSADCKVISVRTQILHVGQIKRMDMEWTTTVELSD